MGLPSLTKRRIAFSVSSPSSSVPLNEDRACFKSDALMRPLPSASNKSNYKNRNQKTNPVSLYLSMPKPISPGSAEDTYRLSQSTLLKQDIFVHRCNNKFSILDVAGIARINALEKII